MKKALGLYAAALYAFLHLPLVILAAFSFNASKFTVWEGFSLRWYGAVFRDPDLAEAAVNSIEIAVVSTVLSTIVGTACAYGFWKRRDRLLSGALYVSLVTPEIVMGVSLLARPTRSEEHTSELQSHLNLVCRLLLEKKKTPKHHRTYSSLS